MHVANPPTMTTDPQRTRILLQCGVAIAPLFLAVAAVQMIARPGFDITQHAVSSLQNGDFGWVQSANFILCGLLAVLCALGLRRRLAGSRGGTWGPSLVGVFGIGMIIAGLFPPDPAFGFPEGAPEGAPDAMSTTGGLHSLGFFAAFLTLIAACFVLARHFDKTLHTWRNICLIAGVVTPLLIILGTVASTDTPGVFYLAAGTVSFTWLSAVASAVRSGRPSAPDPAAATTE
ncbi:DUF998 domain-containing protein [Phytoactinopolyspora limicola]|uniref:DUF998 domain-containing protein n=1 Tax=Phytoactinopolyspora limicola TaxID=2715536 RepID=UPI00140BA1D6|nr:DUF998 domain-containing protein [Phytoactinopolyspora limicola]